MSKVIAKIQKNSIEEIRIELQKYEGYKVIDIRVWAEIDYAMVRTRKGLCIQLELLLELIKALEKVQKQISKIKRYKKRRL